MDIRFSILVPMEFHRGLAAPCIAGWTQNQDFPRDNFEVLIAAPLDADEAELNGLQSMLAPHDRVLRYSASHDMPLVAAAAKEASGDVLIFTEAHCLPRPDFLSQSAKVLLENPNWSGFSGNSIPVTHNLLSEIEAEMYDRDIKKNMKYHPWLKVLDQCFVIRREAYLASGGIEPEYGHFAEWLLAARLFQHGLAIGFDPRPAVEHYYCGDLSELECFTKDFARGQIRFSQVAAIDPCGELFDPVPRWVKRREYQRSTSIHLTQLLVHDFVQGLLGKAKGSKRLRLMRWPWRCAANWFIRRWMPNVAILRSLREAQKHWRNQTQKQLGLGHRVHAKNAFAKLIGTCFALGHAEYLSDWCRSHTKGDPGSEPCDRPLDSATAAGAMVSNGFYETEWRQGHSFQWSEPITTIELPKSTRGGVLTIEWMEFRSPADRLRIRFYLDKQLVPLACISHGIHETKIRLHQDSPVARPFSWICEPIYTANDQRSLGMPVKNVSWQETRNTSVFESHIDHFDYATDRPWNDDVTFAQERQLCES